jgi:hypothetical protein
MRVHFGSLAIVLVLGACGSPGPPAGAECPVLSAVRAVPAFEHRAQQTPDSPESRRRPGYVLYADSGFAQPQGGIAHLCGVHLLVNDSLGTLIAEVTAATGEFDREQERVVARGSVVVELPLQGRRLETEELQYAPRENRVWSPTTTTFQEGGRVLTGSSFSADRHFEQIRMHHARGRL